jgi:hypothetical protein
MTEAGPKFFTQPPPSIDQPFGDGSPHRVERG